MDVYVFNLVNKIFSSLRLNTLGPLCLWQCFNVACPSQIGSSTTSLSSNVHANGSKDVFSTVSKPTSSIYTQVILFSHQKGISWKISPIQFFLPLEFLTFYLWQTWSFEQWSSQWEVFCIPSGAANDVPQFLAASPECSWKPPLPPPSSSSWPSAGRALVDCRLQFWRGF